MSADALILASQSPRRRQLLALLTASFAVRPAAVDETPLGGEAPTRYAARVARDKAVAVDGRAVLAADTTVALGEDILGKPRDRADAAAMLRALSGRRHWVHTALALRCDGRLRELTVSTAVDFAALDDGLLAFYLDSDEPWDKAGAYGIQGRAAAFVRSVHGSYSNVVGLPLVETRELLQAAGLLPRAAAVAHE